MSSSQEQMQGVELGLSFLSIAEVKLLGTVVSSCAEIEHEHEQELERKALSNLGYCISDGNGINNHNRIFRENARVANETAQQRIHGAVHAAAAGKIAVRETEKHTIIRWENEVNDFERSKETFPTRVKKSVVSVKHGFKRTSSMLSPGRTKAEAE